MMFEMLCGHHPYKLRNKNKFEKFQMISDESEPVQLPHYLSLQAKSLLGGLLQKNVSDIYQDEEYSLRKD